MAALTVERGENTVVAAALASNPATSRLSSDRDWRRSKKGGSGGMRAALPMRE
jgi:hypothetical protein